MRRLEAGFYSRYAGGLLLNVFAAKLTEGVFDGQRAAYKSLCLMVMEMVQFDVVNVERVKRLYRGEFGLLVGRSESPTLMTMRRHLSEAAAGAEAEGTDQSADKQDRCAVGPAGIQPRGVGFTYGERSGIEAGHGEVVA